MPGFLLSIPLAKDLFRMKEMETKMGKDNKFGRRMPKSFRRQWLGILVVSSIFNGCHGPLPGIGNTNLQSPTRVPAPATGVFQFLEHILPVVPLPIAAVLPQLGPVWRRSTIRLPLCHRQAHRPYPVDSGPSQVRKTREPKAGTLPI